MNVETIRNEIETIRQQEAVLWDKYKKERIAMQVTRDKWKKVINRLGELQCELSLYEKEDE